MKRLNADIYTKKKRPIRVLQFGEGNFLRAFIDYIINEMNKTNEFSSNVVVVQPLSTGRIEDLRAQDGLYTLFLEGIDQSMVVKKHEIIDCLDDFINPYQDYEGFLNYGKSKDLRFIISNTTEAGIVFDPTDIKHDQTPKSFPGKLLALLKYRFDYFNGAKDKGLHIIPCELIDNNGDKLKKVLVELSILLNYDQVFIDWLTNNNYFYNTLVDRIVPGYPKDEAHSIQSTLGYIDTSMVKGEIFHLWVIEDHYGLVNEFIVPPYLNVKFVEDVNPYREQKVKILNGSHTCMTPIGYLAGINTVKDTVNDEVIGLLIKNYIYDEVIPTLNLPKKEMIAFASSVLERYQNPFIVHELMSIALNSMSKYKTRVLPSVLDNLNKGKFPKYGLFSLASLIVFYRGKRNEELIALQDNPEFLSMFNSLWQTYDGSDESVKKIIKTVLALEHWECDLLSYPNVLSFLTMSVNKILQRPIKEVIKEL